MEILYYKKKNKGFVELQTLLTGGLHVILLLIYFLSCNFTKFQIDS